MRHQSQKGFTLFYALLIASLALAIGVSIFDLTERELELSVATTQSQYAVYAADTGAECALYWDTKGYNPTTDATTTAFATSTSYTGATSGIYCGSLDVSSIGTQPAAGFSLPQTSGNGWTAWTLSSAASAATTTFTLTFGSNATSSCATVVVAKYGNPSATTITSNGFNTCEPSAVQLERTLQLTY